MNENNGTKYSGIKGSDVRMVIFMTFRKESLLKKYITAVAKDMINHHEIIVEKTIRLILFFNEDVF